MDYRSKGKSKSMFINIVNKIEIGNECAIATLNPEKTIVDFKIATGKQLHLFEIEGGKNLYLIEIK